MAESIDVLATLECAAETLVRMKGAEANARLVNCQRDALLKARDAVAHLLTACVLVRDADGPTAEEAALVRMERALARCGGTP